jgi:hypothetical protein
MVIILRGISGSGKSYIVRNFVDNRPLTASSSPAARFLSQMRMPLNFTVFSADDYFMVGDEYKFDPKYLPVAHESCLRMFCGKLERSTNVSTADVGIVVDNTNTTLVEVMPYLALAQAYGHETHVITLISDPAICAMRNQHGVPYTNVMYQDLHLKQSVLEWPQRLARVQQIFPT